jgi:hypothetical protein
MFSYAPKAGVLKPTKNHSNNKLKYSNSNYILFTWVIALLLPIWYRILPWVEIFMTLGTAQMAGDVMVTFILTMAAWLLNTNLLKDNNPLVDFCQRFLATKVRVKSLIPFGYRSDGSGHDHYVTSSNSGFTSVHKPQDLEWRSNASCANTKLTLITWHAAILILKI